MMMMMVIMMAMMTMMMMMIMMMTMNLICMTMVRKLLLYVKYFREAVKNVLAEFVR